MFKKLGQMLSKAFKGLGKKKKGDPKKGRGLKGILGAVAKTIFAPIIFIMAVAKNFTTPGWSDQMQEARAKRLAAEAELAASGTAAEPGEPSDAMDIDPPDAEGPEDLGSEQETPGISQAAEKKQKNKTGFKAKAAKAGQVLKDRVLPAAMLAAQSLAGYPPVGMLINKNAADKLSQGASAIGQTLKASNNNGPQTPTTRQNVSRKQQLRV